jgi:hypothetical protein
MRVEREAVELLFRMRSDTIRAQTNHMRLLQVQAQLSVVRHHWWHPTLREDPSLWVAFVRTRFQHGLMSGMHICYACVQRLARSVDTALPAGVPVERSTRVCIVDGRWP